MKNYNLSILNSNVFFVKSLNIFLHFESVFDANLIQNYFESLIHVKVKESKKIWSLNL